MGLTFSNSLTNIAKHNFFRFDVKYYKIINNVNIKDYILLKDLFEIITGLSLTQYYTDEITNKPYVRISDLSFTDDISKENIIYLNDDCIIEENRILKKDDLILATIGATIGKINLAGDFEGGTFSNNTVVLRLKDKYNKKQDVKFYELLLRSDFMRKIIWGMVSQKSQPNLQDYDLKNLKLPQISLGVQNKILKQIKPIEEGISKLKSSKTSHIDIINEVFGAEFGYTKEDCDRFGKGMTAGTQKFVKREPIHYRCCLSNISNSTNLRNSSRFHNPNSQYFYEKLTARPTIKVLDVLKEIEKGVQPKYDSEGEIPVVKISNLKNSKIDLGNSELISYEWYNSLLKEKSLQKDDVIFCCTGKCSLGKVDIVDFENEAVLSIDNYCLRLDKEKYNTLFFTFFFRSMLGVFQFERDFTGTTNQIHLYDEQIKCFDIPDLSLEKQQEIVSKIESRINAQKDIDKKIAEKRQKISALIENAIRENC